MNQAQLFLSHSPVIGDFFKLSDNDNHLSISFHFIRSSNRILGVSDDCVSFSLIYNLGIRGKTAISPPTWILSVDGNFQIEYSRRGLARQSWAGDQNEERHHPSLFHGLPTLRNLFLAHLVRKSKTCNGCYQSNRKACMKRHLACLLVPQPNKRLFHRSFPADWFHTFQNQAFLRDSGTPIIDSH